MRRLGAAKSKSTKSAATKNSSSTSPRLRSKIAWATKIICCKVLKSLMSIAFTTLTTTMNAEDGGARIRNLLRWVRPFICSRWTLFQEWNTQQLQEIMVQVPMMRSISNLCMITLSSKVTHTWEMEVGKLVKFNLSCLIRRGSKLSNQTNLLPYKTSLH